MSALFSHAVRWVFTPANPISSGMNVGSGGKRGPSTGVRVSAKRQKAPIVLTPEPVKLGLAQLQFRDQLLVLLDGALEHDGVSLRLCDGRTVILKKTLFRSNIPTIDDEVAF